MSIKLTKDIHSLQSLWLFAAIFNPGILKFSRFKKNLITFSLE
ncbi:hypothetical protein Cs308_0876 [Candidatus Chlamydia sanziniae]|uniref:Uncharacterized protein n=1 Tax=Candidatus Chlamydia sanziniae TaxID=1806891 RepID=A0A1A9HYP3_9CHLA|nr:hypothetical protein Cs308_0876 [Candidatus Chlamydia sanziniae]